LLVTVDDRPLTIVNCLMLSMVNGLT
jgi:hypothetical protein